jgi:alpha-beta hydrolase superfamily lysophospholipase
MSANLTMGFSRGNERRQASPDAVDAMSIGPRQLFGWLHWPARASRGSIGVVICKPFGFESLCGQRGLRVMAEAAADCGVPALRFDYSGCGDSQDLEPRADQIENWIQDVLAAVAHLRERTGVKQVCLVGVRLGALLAALAATRSDSIHGLYLFAPVVSGKRYLKELRAAQLAQNNTEDAGELAAGNDGSDPGAGEFGGFILSAASLATLAEIDLVKSTAPPRVAALFIADRSDLPAAQKWSAQLTASGLNTHYAQVPGFVEMSLVAPHWAAVPTVMIDSLRAWLRGLRGDAVNADEGTVSDAGTPPILIDSATVLPLSGMGEGSPVTIREVPVAIQSGASVFGIVTEPDQSEKRRRAVILLNTGVDYHMGVSRTYVTLARDWARSGYHVLRMDLTGIGDSGTAPGQQRDVVYSAAALDDVRAAVEFMRNRFGVNSVTLAGVCSGAYHSLRAAAAGLPVNQILMVNPLTYFWQPGTSLDGLQLDEIVRNPGVYRERMVSAKAWERLLTGKVDVLRILKIYLQRPLLSLRSKARDLARALGIRLRLDLGRELQEIAARGVRIDFVFARGEAGHALLKIEAGSALRSLGARCQIRMIDEGDHTFTQYSARTKLAKVLNQELFGTPGPQL